MGVIIMSSCSAMEAIMQLKGHISNLVAKAITIWSRDRCSLTATNSLRIVANLNNGTISNLSLREAHPLRENLLVVAAEVVVVSVGVEVVEVSAAEVVIAAAVAEVTVAAVAAAMVVAEDTNQNTIHIAYI